MDYTAANEAADAARLAVAAKQLLTVVRSERGLCTVVLADVWSSTAPRCQELATTYVCFDNYRTGTLTMGEFEPGESTARVCDAHGNQIRRGPGGRWSHPLDAQ